MHAVESHLVSRFIVVLSWFCLDDSFGRDALR